MTPSLTGGHRGRRLVLRSGLAAIAVLAVASCGTDLNPGAAATVGDTTITQSTVDDTVTAACEYSEKSREQSGSGTEPTQSVANLRASVTRQLVQLEVTDVATERLGLTVNESTVSGIAAPNIDSIPESIDEDTRELLSDFFTEQARSILGQAVVGAHLRDESITVGDDSLGQEDVDAAQKYLRTLAGEIGVDVSPAYGQLVNGEVRVGSGSLSDPVSDTAIGAFEGLSGPNADLSALPDSQVCG